MQARWITASHPATRARDIRRIAQVALDLGQLADRIVQVGEDVAVEVEVEDRDLIAGVEQLGDEVRTDIAGAAGDQDTLESLGHLALSGLF